MALERFERARDGYLISSDPSLLSLDVINTAFGSKSLHWCTPLPREALRTALNNSYCLGVYDMASGCPAQVGFARLITDYVTLAYVTDVFILPPHQDRGLGNWLVECAAELLVGKRYLRKVMLMAEVGPAEDYYTKKLSARRAETVEDGMVSLWLEGPAAYGLNVKDSTGVWAGPRAKL